MRKLVAVTIFALSIIVSSCYKKRTCACKLDGQDSSTFYINGTKKKAGDKCKNYDETYSDSGVIHTRTCTLK